MLQQQWFPFGGGRPTSMMPASRFLRPMDQAPQQIVRRGLIPQGHGIKQTNPIIHGKNPWNSSINRIWQSHQGGKGGFLAKLFGSRNNVQNQIMRGGLQAFGRNQAVQNSGALLQTATKSAGINGFLNNTQQVLKAAQTLGPVVRQYGPLIKNIPAMWKLYRELNEDDSTDETVEEELEVTDKTDKDEVSTDSMMQADESRLEEDTPNEVKSKAENTKITNGESIPKLYI